MLVAAAIISGQSLLYSQCPRNSEHPSSPVWCAARLHSLDGEDTETMLLQYDCKNGNIAGADGSASGRPVPVVMSIIGPDHKVI